jgi:hypothetical protein
MNIICSNSTILYFVPVIVDINKKEYEKRFVQVEFSLTDPNSCNIVVTILWRAPTSSTKRKVCLVLYLPFSSQICTRLCFDVLFWVQLQVRGGILKSSRVEFPWNTPTSLTRHKVCFYYFWSSFHEYVLDCFLMFSMFSNKLMGYKILCILNMGGLHPWLVNNCV